MSMSIQVGEKLFKQYCYRENRGLPYIIQSHTGYRAERISGWSTIHWIEYIRLLALSESSNHLMVHCGIYICHLLHGVIMRIKWDTKLKSLT